MSTNRNLNRYHIKKKKKRRKKRRAYIACAEEDVEEGKDEVAAYEAAELVCQRHWTVVGSIQAVQFSC